MKKKALYRILRKIGLLSGRSQIRNIVSLLALFSVAMFTVKDGTTTFSSPRSVAVWIQVTDSCRQALSGATFTVAGPDVRTTTGPTSGSVPVSIAEHGGCPIQRGNCVSLSTGCTTAGLPLPSSGTATYAITVARTAPGYGENLRFAICNGGSDCRHGPEVATVRVSASGAISATTLNHYPDGATVTWGPFNGSRGNPIMFHEFGIGDGSIQCDGDHDADDYLTGTPGIHCDSDGGSHKNQHQNQHRSQHGNQRRQHRVRHH